jgi:hypothetical protein
MMMSALGDTRPAGAAPAHLPRRLSITLWDFSWYTQTGPGEPFHDLDAAFAQAVERGFNTVRICAMPFLAFSAALEGTRSLTVRGLGDDFGQRTRWYDVRGGAVLDPRQWLLELFRAARRHDCHVIVSSWEYQQSPCFADTPAWHTALSAVPQHLRAVELARCLSALLDFLRGEDLIDRVAYVEVHNEVDNCALVPRTGTGHYGWLRDPLVAALDLLRERHPDVLMSYSIGEPWVLELADLPANTQVAHAHLYVYGVLGALYTAVGLGHGTEDRPAVAAWPTPGLSAMLRPDAPPFDRYRPREAWRLAATGIPRELFYVHDWVDPDRWDLWLYEHYLPHREAMRRTLSLWVEAVASWGRSLAAPCVIGEGFVGYTPRLARFEEGPVGKDLSEFVVDRASECGFWGSVLTSNAAPHHPMWWSDADWMSRVNRRWIGG